MLARSILAQGFVASATVALLTTSVAAQQAGSGKALQEAAKSGTFQPKIVGGSLAPIGRYPFQAALIRKDTADGLGAAGAVLRRLLDSRALDPHRGTLCRWANA